MDRAPNPPGKEMLSALAANLAARQRLGLGLVQGGAGDLQRMLGALQPEPGPGPPRGALAELRQSLGDCARCPLHKARRHIVFGSGPDNAEVMFIGEGPGQQEDLKGEPFVGPAGQLLDRMLAAVGLERGRVYITNIVKCRPPRNRDPEPGEVQACRPFLDGQVKAIQPKAICTLGRPAAQSILDSKAPISALRGSWRSYEGVPLLPTFHPAFLLRQPERKREAYRDLKALVKHLRES